MKNRYETFGDITLIHITRQTGANVFTVIETKDLELVGSIPGTWSVKSSGGRVPLYYVVGHTNYKHDEHDRVIYLHRWIKGEPQSLMVDHINGNTLDNRSSNLRVASMSENIQNQHRLRSNNKSGVRGVHWYAPRNKWKACITINGKLTHIGFFDDLDEAAKAVQLARAKHMPYSPEAWEARQLGN